MSSPILTAVMDDFGVGIDRRSGGVTADLREAADILNYTITSGKKLVRRPPCAAFSGQQDSRTKGFLYWNGKLYTVAPSILQNPPPEISPINHTGYFPSALETLFFDVPPNCIHNENPSYWRLLALQGTPAGIVALIQHRISVRSGETRWLNYLHVWDGERPTFVWDHACPTTWYPQLPEGLYGEKDLSENTYRFFDQQMTVVAGRVFLSRPDGNIAFSAVNRPRVWSTRSIDHVLQHGEWWYWIMNPLSDTPVMEEVILPILYDDLVSDKKYAAYVLEYFDPETRQWKQFIEDPYGTSGDYAPFHYRIFSTASPWKPAETVIKIQAFVPPSLPELTVFRFRAFPRPPARVNSGLYIAPPNDIVGGLLTHETGTHIVVAKTVTGLDLFSQRYLIVCPVPDAPISISTSYRLSSNAPDYMPLNGQERFWSRILARVTAGNNGTFVYNLTGTVSVSAGRNSVRGTNTNFLEEVFVGDTIVINDERKVVRALLSDTELEVETPFTQAYSGVGLRDAMFRYAADFDTGNTWYATKVSSIIKKIGAEDAGFLATASHAATSNIPVLLTGWTNTLAVQYPHKIQVWNAVSYDSISLLAQYADVFAAPRPLATELDESLAIVTSRGVKLLQFSGVEKNYIVAHDIMNRFQDILEHFKDRIYKLYWWSSQRLLLVFIYGSAFPGEEEEADSTTILVFHYFVQEEIAGWTRWVLRGVPAVETVVEFPHTRGLFLFNSMYSSYWHVPPIGTHSNYTDPGGPFVSSFVTLPCDFSTPDRFKKLLRCDISQRGSCRLDVFVNPSENDPAVLGPPVISGITNGRQRIPLMALGPTIALRFQTVDTEEHQLDKLVLEYTLKGR